MYLWWLVLLLLAQPAMSFASVLGDIKTADNYLKKGIKEADTVGFIYPVSLINQLTDLWLEPVTPDEAKLSVKLAKEAWLEIQKVTSNVKPAYKTFNRYIARTSFDQKVVAEFNGLMDLAKDAFSKTDWQKSQQYGNAAKRLIMAASRSPLPPAVPPSDPGTDPSKPEPTVPEPTKPEPTKPEPAPALPLEGFGTETMGGAGQPEYRVTTLNDAGPGSLRDALSQGNRYITFDVGGAIILQKRLSVRGANITVDGCSAPSPGVTLVGYALEIRGNHGARDVIVQCIRSRNSVEDGIAVTEGAYNIVLDRVSVADSGDGAIDITTWNNRVTHDVTVMRSIVTQPRKNMLLKYSKLHRISLHHNLIADATDRNPRVSTDDDPHSEVTLDFRNNVVFNWRGGMGMNVECGAKANIVNNYFSNPGYSVNDQQQAIYIFAANYPMACALPGSAYIDGNFSTDVKNIDNTPFNLVPKKSTPYPAAPVNQQSACEAARTVKETAGHPIRDGIDQDLLDRLFISC